MTAAPLAGMLTVIAALLITPKLQLPPLDVATVPKPCIALVRRATRPPLALAMEARVSLASCQAIERLQARRDLIDSQDSIAQLDDAARPSFAMLDAAVASQDPRLVLLAEHARGEIYAAMTARMLATLPMPTGGMSADRLQLHNTRAELLATWLAAWSDKAHAAFEAVALLGRHHPELGRDALCARALTDTTKRLEMVAISP